MELYRIIQRNRYAQQMEVIWVESIITTIIFFLSISINIFPLISVDDESNFLTIVEDLYSFLLAASLLQDKVQKVNIVERLKGN